MAYCRDRCNRIYYPNKISGSAGKFRGWFEEGFKQCSKCEFIVKTEDRNCKCCGVQFRYRQKSRYRNNMIILTIQKNGM